MFDPFPAADSGEQFWFLSEALLRNQHKHRLPDRFTGRVAEDFLGARIPARDDPFQRFANDRVVGRLDDGRELRANSALLLNLPEHLIEGVSQQTQLVVAEFHCADGIVAVGRDGRGGASQRDDGLRDLPLQPA